MAATIIDTTKKMIIRNKLKNQSSLKTFYYNKDITNRSSNQTSKNIQWLI